MLCTLRPCQAHSAEGVGFRIWRTQKKLIILVKRLRPTKKCCRMLPLITLRPFHYRSAEVLGLDLGTHPELEKEVRKLKGIHWCGQNGWWYLPLSRESYNQIRDVVAPFATLDARWLRQYLEQKKLAQQTHLQGRAVSPRRLVQFLTAPLCPQNQDALRRYTERLELKAYSRATQKTYTGAFYQL